MAPKADTEFRHSIAIDPDMEAWADLACEYLALEKKPQKKKMLFGALRGFLLNFIIGKDQPRDPGHFLRVGDRAPSIDCALGEGSAEFRRQKQNKIYDFLLWILEKRFSQQLKNGASVVLEDYRLPFSRSNKARDYSFLWLTAAEPSLENWRRYAANYLGLQLRSRSSTKGVIVKFFETCIVHHLERSDPHVIFRAADKLPRREDLFSLSRGGTRVRYELALGDFLDWVLTQEIAKLGDRKVCDLKIRTHSVGKNANHAMMDAQRIGSLTGY